MMLQCEIIVLRAELSDSGPQADLLVVEPGGNAHEVRCLARTDGTAEVGEPEVNRKMQYLVDRYGRQIVMDLRDATRRACQ